MINKLICLFMGHKFRPSRQVFLPARRCKRCDLRQVKVPALGWRDALKPYERLTPRRG